MKTNIRTRILAGLALAILITPAAHSQLAQSRFDTDADGWLSVTLPYPTATPIPNNPTTFFPVWQATGGGYISFQDPDGSQPSGDVQYWLAPAKFAGAKGSAYGGRLSFDLRDTGSGNGVFSQEDVILIGGGLTLVCALSNAPGTDWTQYVVPLTETGWKRGSLGGLSASRDDLQTLLSSLTNIFIRAEYQLGPDTASLDNVVLCAGGRLKIVALGTNIVISWPETACDAVLERSEALGNTVLWGVEGSSPGLINGSYVVTNAVNGTGRFYRLKIQ